MSDQVELKACKECGGTKKILHPMGIGAEPAWYQCPVCVPTGTAGACSTKEVTKLTPPSEAE